MILKFEEYINEGLWSKGVERSQTGELRKGDGKRVKSPWGFEMVLHNPNFNFVNLMKEILDNTEDDPMGISMDSIGNWENYNNGRERLKKIKQGEDPYAYMVDNNYIASFNSYEEAVDEDMYDFDGEGIDEHDYIEVLKAIVDKLKTVDFGKTKGSYSYEIRLLLMDEDREYNYECEMNESTRDWFWDDFKMWFEEAYPDAELDTWSYANYGSNIGVELNYDNLNDFQEMKEEVEDYYKNTIENQEEE